MNPRRNIPVVRVQIERNWATCYALCPLVDELSCDRRGLISDSLMHGEESEHTLRRRIRTVT